MKRYTVSVILVTAAILFFCGCRGPAAGRKQVLARINNYEIGLDEFEAAFKDSVFSWSGAPDARQQFLTNLINQKLILQDAERKGMDREDDFLKTVEKFWEQSLLKVALERKTKEIAASIRVPDKEIQDAYQKMLSEGRTDKSYEQMYGQIKWELSKSREAEELNRWIASLRSGSRIQIREDLLKKDKPE